MKNRYVSELEQLEEESKELDTISRETKERIKQTIHHSPHLKTSTTYKERQT